METISIKYRFVLPDGSEQVYDLQLDKENLELRGNTPGSIPSWVNLDFFQCPNCPLSAKTHPHCPLALNLVNIIKGFDSLVSYEKIHVEVITKERIVSADTTAQKGISSLMGLVIAGSDCPHTVFFKSMARYHLPFASEEETIYRSTSTYLLAQYFQQKKDRTTDIELKGLKNIYENVQIVNKAVAKRLRAATKTDSSVNAIIHLDVFAQILPCAITESLEEICYLFEPFFKQENF